MKERSSFNNNIYAFRLMWEASPKTVIALGACNAGEYFGWIFYSAYFMRYVINALEIGAGFWTIMKFLIITVVVFASLSFMDIWVNEYLIPIEKVKIADTLNRKLYKISRNVDLVCFEDSDFYNKYTLAMENADVRLFDSVRIIWGVICGFVASVCSVAIMISVDKIVGLFIIFPIVGNFLFGAIVSKLEYKRNKEMTVHNRRIAYINRVMYMREYSKEMRMTGIFSLVKYLYDESIKGIGVVTDKYRNKGALYHWFKCVLTFTIPFEGVLFYGAYRALISETMSLSVLAVITSLIINTSWIIIYFAEAVTANIKNGYFINNLRDFIEYKPAIAEDYDGIDAGDKIESIEFKGVSFSYKDKPVLDNVSFKLLGGKSYALVGHNGAGKSTIIKLLLRFYDPTKGQILLNGTDIKEFNLQSYRRLFATAFQGQKILSMSVMENVLMRPCGKDDEPKVLEALKLSGVYDKVSTLSKGMYTTLTKEFDEEGALLSGGEFQKIVVARAFVADTPIKIFDEPSSALDPIAENTLFDNIIANGQDRTMLFISHRLSSVQNADWVFMLEKGHVVEEGTHDKLMALNGRYAEIYNMQADNYLATHKEENA